MKYEQTNHIKFLPCALNRQTPILAFLEVIAAKMKSLEKLGILIVKLNPLIYFS
jgi:hypothetical protein